MGCGRARTPPLHRLDGAISGPHSARRGGKASEVAYGIGVTNPAQGNSHAAPVSGADADVQPTVSRWPSILTWRAHNGSRMESVRVVVTGNRIRASGRITGGECADHPAFSASYDLITDENGATKRLSLRSTVAAGEQHASIARDQENYWLIDTGGTHVRSTFAGALDVDVVLSPFFNTLPIRRHALARSIGDVEVPVVYVRLPDLLVQEASLTYSAGSDGIHVLSPVSSATLTVDPDGFVLDYPGLAQRI